MVHPGRRTTATPSSDSYPYTNEFSQYLFNFWQYTDYYGSWHGMPTEEVPESMYQDERGVTDAWKNRKFEFGLVNLPNPGYTNAAHKERRAVHRLYLPAPYRFEAYQAPGPRTRTVTSPMRRSSSRCASTYGIAGWFINQEEAIPSTDIPLYKAFIEADAGCRAVHPVV